MRFVLVGASGFAGSRVLNEALGRGHEVTAISRHADRLPERPGLTRVTLDIQDPDQVDDGHDPDRLVNAFAGHDCVISCFNPGHDIGVNPHLYREVVEGTRAILDGVKRSGVPRFVYLGGAGSLHGPNGQMLVDDLAFFVKLADDTPPGTLVPTGPPSFDIPRSCRIAFYLVEREQSFDWTFISPGLYMGEYGGGTGRLRYGTDQLLLDDDGKCARLDVEDLAIAIVDEAETARHAGQHLTLATQA